MSSVHSSRYQRFLKRLRQARLDAKLTQVDAAKRLRVPQSYVSKCEMGERRVDFSELQLFALAYKKSLKFFEDQPALIRQTKRRKRHAQRKKAAKRHSGRRPASS